MRIGELSRLTGVEPQTIRFYEKQGLLSKSARQTNGYRAYSDIHREQLFFIRRCRILELSLVEIQKLMKLRTVSQESCEVINSLIDKHISDVRTRISALLILEEQLASLRSCCANGREVSDCGILASLSEKNK